MKTWIEIDKFVRIKNCLLNTKIFGKYQSKHSLYTNIGFFNTILIEKPKNFDCLNSILNSFTWKKLSQKFDGMTHNI